MSSGESDDETRSVLARLRDLPAERAADDATELAAGQTSHAAQAARGAEAFAAMHMPDPRLTADELAVLDAAEADLAASAARWWG